MYKYNYTISGKTPLAFILHAQPLKHFSGKGSREQMITMKEDGNSSRQKKNMAVGSKYSIACSHHSIYSLKDNSNHYDMYSISYIKVTLYYRCGDARNMDKIIHK